MVRFTLWLNGERTNFKVNVQSFFHENVVFSVCARMDNASYIIFIMWNSISGLESWNYFSCGVAVMVRSHKKISGNFLRGGGGQKIFEGKGDFLSCLHF